ncbi:LA2681 family HEPN domain-containing protein [Billgrantia pellis]|uniref:LA2681 family HEPN domain-containing protein n=1 Tax=Billgrantia pellis TaxID=2606936 RepID=UPI001CAA1F59|nr:LA2681 family HEPN domain-containing protein [Halomonas pellis]
MERAEQVLMDSDSLALFTARADELIDSKDHQAIKTICDVAEETDFVFQSPYDESRYYYSVGNLYEELYKYSRTDWFSDDLSMAVLYFRKALHAIGESPWDREESHLKSCIETNLANNLSSQGRALCAIPFYDSAIKQGNPIAFVSKANNEIFIAGSLYDQDHAIYHLRCAYNNFLEPEKRKHLMHPSQRKSVAEGGRLKDFSKWYQEKSGDFYFNDEFKLGGIDRKEREYLDWVDAEKLFLNDLNDILSGDLVKQDVLSLPSFVSYINQTLSLSEGLAYHGNFDELKNDFCYARYLLFVGLSIPEDVDHFYNSTYRHIEDFSYTINNLKTSHYKNSFRIFYSLLDKIAYFIYRFFDLGPIDNDGRVSFINIFVNTSGKTSKPNKALENSKNPFIHALFFILKDIRELKSYTNISKWVDPDVASYDEIRNAMEHRSLKIVDDFGKESVSRDYRLHENEVEKVKEEIRLLRCDIEGIFPKIREAKQSGEVNKRKEAETEKSSLESQVDVLQKKLHEKEKLSSHSVLVSITEFERRLKGLAKLCRNSLMYLSLAIEFEESQKESDGLVIPREVPLK